MYLYFKWDMVLNIMLKLTNKGFVLADSIIGLIIICSGILILLTNYLPEHQKRGCPRKNTK